MRKEKFRRGECRVLVKIHELQYVVDNIDDKKERDIEYSTWDKYIDDILSSPKRQEVAYPSLPRNTCVDHIIESTDNKLVIRFYHFLTTACVEHVVTLIEENNETE